MTHVPTKAGLAAIRARARELLTSLSLAEKAGQMTQYFYFGRHGASGELAAMSAEVEAALARGEAGALLFVCDAAETNRLQKLAIDGNRHQIPVPSSCWS